MKYLWAKNNHEKIKDTLLEQCSLEKRRIVHELGLTYKIVFRLVDVPTSIIILHYEMTPHLLEVIHTRFY